jgi:hypothetical protein
MSVITLQNPGKAVVKDPERPHRLLLKSAYILAGALIVGVGVYGFDYYPLDSLQRVYSAKHQTLRPSGFVGLSLGILGAILFCNIFLYAIRKHWTWLRKWGSNRHWLNFHVLMGLTAPLVIAFHAAFRFHGLAGMAFWIMVAVALSGVVGRYLYSQIPRNLNAAELSLAEARVEQDKLTRDLAGQKLFSEEDLAPLFRLPSKQRVASESMLMMFLSLIALDVLRFLHVAKLRRKALGWGGSFATMGGLLNSQAHEIENVILLAGKQAAMSKRILFLSRSQKVLNLWHVVHKPFSYSFVVLAIIHITVELLIGVR